MTDAEADIQRLEAYLDGELTSAERSALAERLGDERDLADALDDLRSARMTRAAVWQSLEPDDVAVERLIAGIDSGVRQAAQWRRRAAALRWVSAAAASVLLGVGLGWFGRTIMAPQAPGIAAPVAQAPVSAGPAAQSPMPDARGTFRVALTDESGNVIAVQPFESMERARAFTQDLQQWQLRQRQAQDGNLILVGDRF